MSDSGEGESQRRIMSAGSLAGSSWSDKIKCFSGRLKPVYKAFKYDLTHNMPPDDVKKGKIRAVLLCD